MANHLAPAAALLTAGLALAGCVALWQDDHKIEASTGQAVTIEYDPLLLASSRVAATAQTECGKFQRIAVLDHVRKGVTWTKIADFRCENDPVTPKISVASLPPAIPTAGTTYRSLPSPFPAAPPNASKVETAGAQVAALPAVPPDAPRVQIIDARGPNFGVTHRQVAQTPKERVAKAQIAKERTASAQTVSPPVRTVPVHNLKTRNAPVASLKRSILS